MVTIQSTYAPLLSSSTLPKLTLQLDELAAARSTPPRLSCAVSIREWPSGLGVGMSIGLDHKQTVVAAVHWLTLQLGVP